MAFTFDAALTTDRDRLRFTLGDVDEAVPGFPDETYDALLAANGADFRASTLALADALIMRWSQQPDSISAEGAEALTYKQRLVGWQAVASRLRKEIAAEDGTPRMVVLRPGRHHDRAEYYAGCREGYERTW